MKKNITQQILNCGLYGIVINVGFSGAFLLFLIPILILALLMSKIGFPALVSLFLPLVLNLILATVYVWKLVKKRMEKEKDIDSFGRKLVVLMIIAHILFFACWGIFFIYLGFNS